MASNAAHAIRLARRWAEFRIDGLVFRRGRRPSLEEAAVPAAPNLAAAQCGGGSELGCPFDALTVRSRILTAPCRARLAASSFGEYAAGWRISVRRPGERDFNFLCPCAKYLG